jgi:DsbC/DsbD-like thiol-disulfide interchange protein
MIASLLAAACALAQQNPVDLRGGSAGDSRGDRLVRVDLLADRAAIRPGETFTLGVKLTVDRGWHIYWENPGDSGFPTKATISGPEDFEIGDLRFPAPERDVAEGDIVTYIHRGEVMLVADVRVPRELAQGFGPGSKVTFEIEASWLVCTDVCFPGSGKARLEVPIAAAGDPPAPANEKLFAVSRARLPRPWKELEGAELEWSGGGKSPQLRISVPRASDLEIFPLASATTSLESRLIAKDERFCRLTAEVRFRKESPEDRPRLQGVLRVRTEQGESFFDLDSTFGKPLADVRASK